MRREKRRAEFEERYRADQERKRAAKHKRKNSLPGDLPVMTAADDSAARDPSGRYETQSPSFK